MTAKRSSDWQPAASPKVLQRRAALLRKTRAFFEARGFLEVETPILGAATVTDPHLQSLRSTYAGPAAARGPTLFLQTSPEYAMKRLLAAGSGPIFQLTKAFRGGESGGLHNPEFTLLEWYRPGFDHHALMNEMDDFLAAILRAKPAERMTYAEAFERHARIDPHRTPVDLLEKSARALVPNPPDLGGDRDGWLQLILVHAVEPHLGKSRPCYLYDFPASQAALARVRSGDPPLAERFEVYIEGIELANGFHELTDAREQRRRFERDRERRRELGLEDVPVDERFLAALEEGLPDCAGVALGFDRLVMVAAGTSSVSEVIAFPMDRA